MIEEYKSIVNKITEIKQNIAKELSEIDIELNDCVHVLEYNKMDAITLSKFTKLYRNLLIRRREIKEEQIMYCNAVNNTPQTFTERYDEYLQRQQERDNRYKNESNASLHRIIRKYSGELGVVK